MKKSEIIYSLVTDRSNHLSVKSITLNVNPHSKYNPKISVGTIPFGKFAPDKRIRYVITTSFLDCTMLSNNNYEGNPEYFTTLDVEKAERHLLNIINKELGR